MPVSVRQIKVRSRKNRKPSGQKKISLKSILRKKEKKARLYLLVGGLLLVFAAFYTSGKAKIPKENPLTVNETTGESLSTSFANEPISVDKKFLEPSPKQTKPKNPPVRILIPSINIDLPVKEAKIINGYWEVFSDTAGFGLGSAYPEEKGNQVIFAHARAALFGPLKEIKTGANITVMTYSQWYSYTVTEIKEVLPSQTEVIAPSTEAVLTLYTCTGYADSKRLIVTAKRNPS